MAEVTASTFYTNQLGTLGNTPVRTAPRTQTPRQFRIRRDLDATEVATNTFNLIKLDIGQTMVPGSCKCTHGDLGTTLTIDVGDSADAYRYANGLDLSAVGQTNFCDPAIPDGESNPFKVTAATQNVIVTIATSGTPLADELVFYVELMDEYAEQS